MSQNFVLNLVLLNILINDLDEDLEGILLKCRWSVCVCVCVCVRARVRARVSGCVRAHVCVHGGVGGEEWEICLRGPVLPRLWPATRPQTGGWGPLV